MTIEQLWHVFDDWYTDTEIHLYLVGLHYQTCYTDYKQLLYDYGTFVVNHFSHNAAENTITIHV